MSLDTLMGFFIAMLMVIVFLTGMSFCSMIIQDDCDSNRLLNFKDKTYICKEQGK
jgi:hypothetical protein